MNNDHDTIYGKLNLVTNTSQLVEGPAQQVVLSANQGRLPAHVAPPITCEWHNFVTCHYEDHQMVCQQQLSLIQVNNLIKF